MADLAKIVEDLSKLTVLEAADLAKMLEEKWGVSAAAAVAAPAAAGPAAAADSNRFLTGKPPLTIIKAPFGSATALTITSALKKA